MDDRTVHFDTSVVMRLLVGEPLEQFRAAARFLDECVGGGKQVHVGDLVLAEAYFALQQAYAMPKEEALGLLAAFSSAPGIVVSGYARQAFAEPNLARAKPGFADRLIHGHATVSGSVLVTFEKAAAKLSGTVVLKGLQP